MGAMVRRKYAPATATSQPPLVSAPYVIRNLFGASGSRPWLDIQVGWRVGCCRAIQLAGRVMRIVRFLGIISGGIANANFLADLLADSVAGGWEASS